MICCASLPQATTLSVPICDLVFANEGLADEEMAQFFHAAGRSFVKDAFTPSNVPETSSIVHSVEQ